MRSDFLLGIAGFLIVFGTLVGGIILAGICEELLTPNWKFFDPVWLWLGLLPFSWICARTFQIERPFLKYIGLLPLAFLLGIVASLFSQANL